MELSAEAHDQAMAPPPPPPPASSSPSASAASSPATPDAPPPPASTPPPPVSAASGAAPPPPPPPPPPPSATPASSVPSHVKSSTSAGTSPSTGSTPSSPGHTPSTPHSKLVSHQPLDSPDDLDRKWYAHFYHMQKTIQGKDEAAALAILKQQPPSSAADKGNAATANAPPPLTFQPDVALLYAIVTEPPLAKQSLRYLTTVAAADSYKNVIGWLQKLIDQRFVKLLGSCRSQLLWLVREFVHINVPGVDKVIMALMRHLTGGDASRTSVWLASSIVRILIEHESWLLACSNFIPYVFHTFARTVVDHNGHASLLQQEIDLCTTLWNRRQSDVAQLGREVVRVLNDAKDIPGMNTLWKQLRGVRDDSDHDSGIFSVARLMAIPTPPKYLAFRLSPRMEEYIVFMMERVQIGYVTRYQKWFASQFLSSPGSDAVVPDLVRYICAVYHPSNQILSSKITPRYHILGWLYLLCKSPTVLARVQLAMFFDFLYFKQSDNIMNVEPAILLMVKSLKSHPQMTLAMIQFLLFAVEKFASSSTNKQLMRNGVSTAFAMLLKLGVVSSIHVLQSFPLLQATAPELKAELHRIFPEHFPSPDAMQAHVSSPLHSPGGLAGGSSPVHSPGRGLSSPGLSSPAHESPLLGSPHGAGSHRASPGHPQSPSHSESSVVSTVTSSDALSTSSFLPDNHEQSGSSIEETSEGKEDAIVALASGLSEAAEVPSNLLVLGLEEFKSFQSMMPKPQTRPTEGFLESLNDILISWIRQENALELAAPLGTFLHSSLETIIVTSRISMGTHAKATCAGVFDSMLDQVLSESQELFLPFLQAMHTRDVTLGFRLLGFCCARSDDKSVEATLAPYTAFVDSIGGTFAQNLIKDLSLSQHIDDARAHSIAFLDKPSASIPEEEDEVSAVDATVLYIAPYLFKHSSHSTLSKVVARGEGLIQLVLSLTTPVSFQALCSRVILHEFEILQHCFATVLLSSLSWSSWEQFVLWDLVIVETQASNSASSVKTLMAAARKVLACLNPQEHVETLNGLLKTLLHFAPDASLLQAVLKLRASLDEFALAVLSNWIDRHADVVKNFILVILQTGSESTKDVDAILYKLERLELRRAKNRPNSGPPALLQDDALLAALRPLVKTQDFPGLAKVLASAAPNNQLASLSGMSAATPSMLSSTAPSVGGDEPPAKKQRLGSADES